jgi:hypothetical protein
MFRSKYFTIKQVDEELHEGKPVYRLFSNLKKDEQMGIINHSKEYRRYVFSAHDKAVFADDCLRDIIYFIDTQILKLPG